MNPLKKLFQNRGKRDSPTRSVPRIFAYCASNIGLGHYGRLARVLGEIQGRLGEASILLASDTRDDFLARERFGKLRLPGFRFADDGSFAERPEGLAMSNAELRDLRAEILLAAGREFDPDLVLMDTNAHGKRDEMLPLLKELRRRRRARIVLMMRDIPCPPGEEFKLNGPAARIQKHAALYDRLFVAGDERFFDVAEEYAWPESIRRKLVYTGFVVPHVAREDGARAWSGIDGLGGIEPPRRKIVASFGGGWEAETLGARLIEAVRLFRKKSGEPVQLLMTIGPAMGDEAFGKLREQAAGAGGIFVSRLLAEFPALLASADLAILHAGSTPFQILDSDIPIVLTCRDYKSREQQARAERLARFDGVRVVEPEGVETENCFDWLEWGLNIERGPRQTGMNFGGVARAAAEAIDLLGRAGETP